MPSIKTLIWLYTDNPGDTASNAVDGLVAHLPLLCLGAAAQLCAWSLAASGVGCNKSSTARQKVCSVSFDTTANDQVRAKQSTITHPAKLVCPSVVALMML